MSEPEATADTRRSREEVFGFHGSRRAGLAGLLILAACAAGRAQTPPAQAVAGLVAKFRARTKALVGVRAVRLADGAVVCDVGSDRLLIPASNQKILTSAVVLHRLGRDFKFRTQVHLAGEDLVVGGDGDPTTGDPTLAAARGEDIYAAFDRWAKALKAAGVEKIQGDLVIRAGIFRPPHVHPDWPRRQLQRWYAAPVAGVNFRNNCLLVGFKVAEGKAEPVIAPASRFLTVENKVKVAKKHLWSCRFDALGLKISLRGTVARTTPDPYPVAVTKPAMLFGAVLADRIVRAGVGFDGKIIVATDYPGRTQPPPPGDGGQNTGFRLIAVETTPLADALRRANCHSLNMTAECLFLRSALEGGKPAGWESAAEVAEKVLRARYGLRAGQFRISDGSGLSRRNLVTPAAITELLRALAAEEPFVKSLAVSGRTGSMRRRLRRRGGRVLGKTGSLAGASALSGYVLDRKGVPAVAFSIITNGRTRRKRASAKDLEDRICEVLVRSVDPPPATGSAPARRAAP